MRPGLLHPSTHPVWPSVVPYLRRDGHSLLCISLLLLMPIGPAFHPRGVFELCSPSLIVHWVCGQGPYVCACDAPTETGFEVQDIATEVIFLSQL